MKGGRESLSFCLNGFNLSGIIGYWFFWMRIKEYQRKPNGYPEALLPFLDQAFCRTGRFVIVACHTLAGLLIESGATVKRLLSHLFALCLLVFPLLVLAEEELTLDRLLQRTLDNHPDLLLADLDVEHARQELPQVESRTGFVLGWRGGYSREISFIGTPSDIYSLGGELGRTLSSGERIGLSASLRREDNSGGAVFRGYPNPADSINADLSYRKPLWRGDANPEYNQGLVIARQQTEIARARRREQRDRLAQQAIDLFYSALFTGFRLANSRDAIRRAQRLKGYIEERSRLGLAEKQDRLQAQARLEAERAAHRSLELLWSEQQISLNRLLGMPWDNRLRLLEDAEGLPASGADIETILGDAYRHSPALEQQRARLEIARAVIEQRRDARRDMLDLVVSAGVRNLAGDTGEGFLNRSDVAGGVSVEYQKALDLRGFDAALYQAQLERDRVLQEMERLRYELRYRVAGLVAEIGENRKALESYRRRLESEAAKYRESERLYRGARLDTSLLIQHEAELQAAELALQQQRVELLKRRATLALLRGKLTP